MDQLKAGDHCFSRANRPRFEPRLAPQWDQNSELENRYRYLRPEPLSSPHPKSNHLLTPRRPGPGTLTKLSFCLINSAVSISSI